MISIVIATEEHLDRIAEIERGAISPAWSSEALLDEMGRGDSFFIVAVEEASIGAPRASHPTTTPWVSHPATAKVGQKKAEEPFPCLGFAVFRRVGGDGELLQIAVDESARRKGVGDTLMSAVLDYALTNDCTSVFLEVRSGNTAAIGLYEKHDFSTVRVRKDYYDCPVEDALVMSRTLV